VGFVYVYLQKRLAEEEEDEEEEEQGGRVREWSHLEQPCSQRAEKMSLLPP